MNAIGKHEMPIMFPHYMAEFERLSYELNNTPGWRMFKQARLLREQGKLNRWYRDKMIEWGLDDVD